MFANLIGTTVIPISCDFVEIFQLTLLLPKDLNKNERMKVSWSRKIPADQAKMLVVHPYEI